MQTDEFYLIRIVIIHDLLPYRVGLKGRSAKELMRELANRGIAVTVRTVQRDLEAWAEIFDLECDRNAEEHYWRRTRKADLARHFQVDDFCGDPVDVPGKGARREHGNSTTHPEWPHEPEQWMGR